LVPIRVHHYLTSQSISRFGIWTIDDRCLIGCLMNGCCQCWFEFIENYANFCFISRISIFLSCAFVCDLFDSKMTFSSKYFEYEIVRIVACEWEWRTHQILLLEKKLHRLWRRSSYQGKCICTHLFRLLELISISSSASLYSLEHIHRCSSRQYSSLSNQWTETASKSSVSVSRTTYDVSFLSAFQSRSRVVLGSIIFLHTTV
jgi:hypothetical protein